MKQSKNQTPERLQSLINEKKASEKQKGIEKMLIVGIVVFCVTALYFVFAPSKNNDDNSKNVKYNPTEKHGKATSKETKHPLNK